MLNNYKNGIFPTHLLKLECEDDCNLGNEWGHGERGNVEALDEFGRNLKLLEDLGEDEGLEDPKGPKNKGHEGKVDVSDLARDDHDEGGAEEGAAGETRSDLQRVCVTRNNI